MFAKFFSERQPYHHRMSYDSLNSIVPHMELPKRLQLSFLSPIVHGINRRVPFSLSFLKFRQTYSNPDCTTGVLSVESVEYSFESIDACHVEIRCLGRRRVSREKDVARRYFEYFLRTSVLPVRQLELIHCNTQFHNFHGIPIPRLTLHRHPRYPHGTIQNFPAGHRMELVKLIDSRVSDLENPDISSARHIKFWTRLVKYDRHWDNTHLMQRFFEALYGTEGKVECKIRMHHAPSFSIASEVLLNRRMEIGSYVTGVFEKNFEFSHIQSHLFNWFFEYSPKVTRMNGRKCVVLKDDINYTLVVFRDYSSSDSFHDCTSFTSILLPKERERSDCLRNKNVFLFIILFIFLLMIFWAFSFFFSHKSIFSHFPTRCLAGKKVS